MQRKKVTRTIENISKRELSIQFSLDGFSFCISNFKGEKFHFSSYKFPEKLASPELILEKIQEIFKSDSDLQDDFESVLVIHENNLSTFVPNRYFKEEALKDYLKFSVKTISTDYIAYDDLENQDIKNVYIPYINVNNFLFQNFGSFEYQHHASVLVEKLLSYTKDDSLHCYVNVSDTLFDMVVIENQKLIFHNTFDFQSKEDFIYYILFNFEQLKLDPNENSVIFSGNIHKESDLYKIAYKYIKTVAFLKAEAFAFDNKEIEDHSNFILLG
ncbi:DUF3822 family protein [Pseudotenacibaculum haliotis]|uniref:DUF3822 family protein n=1 Tax=Pseudotenacibaculum haliotis TaxID=1862138 RepID=A0ABW5LUH0_9FLAO